MGGIPNIPPTNLYMIVLVRHLADQPVDTLLQYGCIESIELMKKICRPLPLSAYLDQY